MFVAGVERAALYIVKIINFVTMAFLAFFFKFVDISEIQAYRTNSTYILRKSVENI
jgi:hypothetical protein